MFAIWLHANIKKFHLVSSSTTSALFVCFFKLPKDLFRDKFKVEFNKLIRGGIGHCWLLYEVMKHESEGKQKVTFGDFNIIYGLFHSGGLIVNVSF